MSDEVKVSWPRPGLRIEEWTSPLGNYREIRVVPEEYEHETREEWAERLGLDLSVFQRKNKETPEEKAKRIAEATAENQKLLEEWGYVQTPEMRAELDAVLERMGIHNSDGETETE